MAEKTKAAEKKTAEAADNETLEMVFTLKSDTGEVVKVEWMQPDGSRQELSDEEYQGLFAALGGGAGDAEALGYAEADPYEQAYYQGLADYEAAVAEAEAALCGYTPEELAYLQGMADYEAALG